MSEIKSTYYTIKKPDYFANVRGDLLALVPSNPMNKILEVGAAGGYSLIELKRIKKAAECVGIELFDLPGTLQHDPLIDKMFIGNIETDYFSLPDNYFDVIICGDVLEHLVDPWQVLQKITKWLKPGGVIIISTPNFRFIKVMWRVFFGGRFDYDSWGIMDKTHLRFFCKPNIVALASTGDLKLESIQSNLDFFKYDKAWWINRLTLRMFNDFFTTQYITKSRKVD